MLVSYLNSAFRIIVKERLYTLINIVGLSVGLASCFVIYSWVSMETSYDKFSGSEQVYRVNTFWDGSEEGAIASTYPMVKTRVLSQFPEIEESVRVYDQGFLGHKTRASYYDKVFIDNNLYYADEGFFNIFPLLVIDGDVSAALSDPRGMILTQSTADKIFGDEDPIGKIMTIDSDKEFVVSAIIEDVPANMHFDFDLMASMLAHPWIKGAEENVWSGIVFHTYLKLEQGGSGEQLYNKISTYMDNFPNDPEGVGREYDFRLQPVEDIHLNSDLKFELAENGNIDYVYIFTFISILVLVVAIINYSNLATARHTLRMKEVGVRKILGANRTQLLSQFVLESSLVTLAAFLVAILLIFLVQPYLATFSGFDFVQVQFWNTEVILGALVISILVGIITGGLPAMTLSHIKPIRLFHSNLGSFANGGSLRKFLVVSQFALSIVLTMCSLIIYKQLVYIRDTNIGYDREHRLALDIGYGEILSAYTSLKDKMLANSEITGATAVSQLPLDIQTAENIDISSSQNLGVYYASVDPDFFKVMDIEIVSGEEQILNIQPDDSLNYFVLNESVTEAIGWDEEEALNRMISIRHGNQNPGPVKGVFKDFHFQTFHHQIAPLVLEFNPSQYQYLLLKIRPENTVATMEYVEDVWKEFAGHIPLNYMFLEQEYDKLYKSEIRSSSLFIVFTAIALAISLLGLFGLAAFSAERRTKEIGMRKILGASGSNIVFIASRDFGLLLLISFLLAIPFGYFFKQSWMTEFVFKADISVWLFIFAGAVNFIFALLTVIYHVLRITRTNLIEVLKYE